MCQVHARNVLGLEVKTSQLPKSGLGLFATRDFAKNTRLDCYKGRVFHPQEHETYPGYSLQISAHRAVDPGPWDCFGRYANSARDINHPFTNNAEFRPGRPYPWVVSTRDIREGEEIFIDYQASYWDEFEANYA